MPSPAAVGLIGDGAFKIRDLDRFLLQAVPPLTARTSSASPSAPDTVAAMAAPVQARYPRWVSIMGQMTTSSPR
jgi:hypothetical protein